MEYEQPTKLDRLMHAVAEHRRLSVAVTLVIHGHEIRVESNSAPLIAAVRGHYGSDVARDEPMARSHEQQPSTRVVLIEALSPDLGCDFQLWPRDPHALVHREEYVELSGGRIVRDPVSKLQFLLGQDLSLVIGACLEHKHRVFELINAGVMECLGAVGYVPCRGAAVSIGQRALAICGPARSGRSTLALRLVEQGAGLLASERFLLSVTHQLGNILGVPDAPRATVGTMFGSPALRGLLSDERRRELGHLTASDLWALDHAQSVDLEAAFGRNVLCSDARIRAVIALAWDPSSTEGCVVTRRPLREHPTLAAWLAKRPGPLCRSAVAVAGAATDGATDALSRDYARYLQRLSDLETWQFTGGVDFARATELCLDLLT